MTWVKKSNTKILWAILNDDTLRVYHVEDGIPVLMNSIYIIGHEIRFLFKGVEQATEERFGK